MSAARATPGMLLVCAQLGRVLRIGAAPRLPYFPQRRMERALAVAASVGLDRRLALSVLRRADLPVRKI